MTTALHQIKDTAYRIYRLGAYLSSGQNGLTAEKEKGVLRMRNGFWASETLECLMRSGQVSVVCNGDSTIREVLDETSAVHRLKVFEEQLTRAVERQLREEVMQDLVSKRLRRIIKTKARGFQADLKKKSKAKKNARG